MESTETERRKDRNIFYKDPIELKNWVDKTVEITTVDDEVIFGRVYTIDPVSESIILFNTEENEGTVEVVLGHAVKCVKLSSSKAYIPMLDIFDTQKVVISVEDKDVKRKKLKNWLLKNRIPVEEDGDVLIINKILSIYPPYSCDQCISTNSITLSKIQHLISQLPSP